MVRVANIQLNKATKGKLKSLTFNVKKQAHELKPTLEKLGIAEAEDSVVFEKAV